MLGDMLPCLEAIFCKLLPFCELIQQIYFTQNLIGVEPVLATVYLFKPVFLEK